MRHQRPVSYASDSRKKKNNSIRKSVEEVAAKWKGSDMATTHPKQEIAGDGQTNKTVKTLSVWMGDHP